MTMLHTLPTPLLQSVTNYVVKSTDQLGFLIR